MVLPTPGKMLTTASYGILTVMHLPYLRAHVPKSYILWPHLEALRRSAISEPVHSKSRTRALSQPKILRTINLGLRGFWPRVGERQNLGRPRFPFPSGSSLPLPRVRSWKKFRAPAQKSGKPGNVLRFPLYTSQTTPLLGFKPSRLKPCMRALLLGSGPSELRTRRRIKLTTRLSQQK